METRILVPLDGSSLAEQALSCAITLARELPGELVLLRAVSIPPDVLANLDESPMQLNALAARLEAEAGAYLDALAEQLGPAGLRIHHVVRRGPAAEAILDYAGQESVDLIVMATHGYSGIKRWTHGSVAERVLQAARAPLLLVRAAGEEVTVDRLEPARCLRILVPLDGSAMAEQVLPTVVTVAQAMGSAVILFQAFTAHVSGWMTSEWHLTVQDVLEAGGEYARTYLRAVAGRLAEQGLDVDVATSSGPVANCIVEYAEAHGVDLIAMCTHGRTGLARWALGSVADRVLRAGSTPILLVRAR